MDKIYQLIQSQDSLEIDRFILDLNLDLPLHEYMLFTILFMTGKTKDDAKSIQRLIASYRFKYANLSLSTPNQKWDSFVLSGYVELFKLSFKEREDITFDILHLYLDVLTFANKNNNKVAKQLLQVYASDLKPKLIIIVRSCADLMISLVLGKGFDKRYAAEVLYGLVREVKHFSKHFVEVEHSVKIDNARRLHLSVPASPLIQVLAAKHVAICLMPDKYLFKLPTPGNHFSIKMQISLINSFIGYEGEHLVWSLD